jgi:hypothetical protein
MKNNSEENFPPHIRNILYYEEEEEELPRTDQQQPNQQPQTKPRDPLSQESQPRFTI